MMTTTTHRQRNLIYRLGWRLNLDYEALAVERYGKRLDDLTVKEAGEYIEWMKAYESEREVA